MELAPGKTGVVIAREIRYASLVKILAGKGRLSLPFIMAVLLLG
jgi:hypothetical protein